MTYFSPFILLYLQSVLIESQWYNGSNINNSVDDARPFSHVSDDSKFPLSV